MTEHWKGQADGFHDDDGADIGTCDLVARPHRRDHCGKAWVRYVEPLEFTAELIVKIFDKDGNWIGTHERKVMTKEEFMKMYPDFRQSESEKYQDELEPLP
jgi:hypothetical protein